jgi:histidine ammonia-lyase
LNNKIYPVIYEHGSVGASGDLVQLADCMRALIGEGLVYHNNEIKNTKNLQLPDFSLGLRDALAFINETAAMTAIGLDNLFLSEKLIYHSIFLSSILIELFNSYDDPFPKELNKFKHHEGQNYVAMLLSQNLNNSKLISKRFKENKYSPNIQEIYSLRCTPQIIGPIYETYQNAKKILLEEFNSVNDNPIFDFKNKVILFGGNFHGDYVSFEMDKLKISISKLSLLLNRQFVLLNNPAINKKFPPFQNYKTLGLDLGLQAVEFVSASTTSENLTLSFPNYLHNIVSNNDNQDIVSMGTNSALITKKVIENTFQILSATLLALMYAIYYNNIFNQLTEIHKIYLKKIGYNNL